MIRNIYVGENYSRKVVTPLITTDQNSYKIIWDTKCKNGVFKITAIKADNSAVFDFGELSAEGVATYVVANNMYDTEGPLKLFLAIAEQDSITTCREINFTVKEGADEASLAENNVNPINNLAMQVSANSNENNTKILNLKNYGVTDVYILKEGEDIIVSENIVTGFLKHSYSQYEAIAFPEGITEINLPDTNGGGNTPLTANKVIMPKSLKSIGSCSFSNYARWDEKDNLIDSSIVVNVKEYVLNEGLEIINRYAFADNIYLEKINIPQSLKNIEMGVFQYSDSLKEIFIPATVTEIGDGNFNSSTFKQEDSTIIYGYAGSVAEYYAKNQNFLKEYANTFVNIGSDYSDKVDKIEGKGLSTEDFTTAEKERIKDLDKNGVFGGEYSNNGHKINFGANHLVSGSDNIIDGGWGVALLGSFLHHISGNHSLITGRENKNSGEYSVIGGYQNEANGSNNMLLGACLKALKGYTVMLGSYLSTKDSHCTLIGHNLETEGFAQTILGRFNAPSNNPFVVAYGSSDADRKNIFEVTSNGKAISKEVETDAIILKSPNGKFRLTVNDNGELVTEEVTEGV